MEGDSAGGSAKSGRDSQFQAILPLRGKILNTERARIDRILDSEQVGTLITALGTGFGKADEKGNGGFNVDKLRYHKIIIMTDADVDGAHIRTLLLTFFLRHMPALIERGYVYIAQPPLFGVRKGKAKDMTYLLDQEALAKHVVSLGIGPTVSMIRGDERLEGEELAELTVQASRDVELIKEIDVVVRNVDLTNVLVVTGALSQYVFTAENGGERTARHVAEVMNRSGGTGRWSGRATDDGYELTWKDKGSSQTYRIREELARLPATLDLLGDFDRIKEDYGTPWTLLRGDRSVQVNGPWDLFHAVDEWGRRDLAIQRYKGLGEMNFEQLGDTTLNPANRTLVQVAVNDPIEADLVTGRLMGNDPETRREALSNRWREAEVDL